VTGAPYVLEGSALNGGFAKITTAADPTLSRITEGLGDTYSVMDIYFKPYTACRHTHGAAQAALELVATEDVDLAQVASITVSTYGIAELAVGKGVDASSSFVSAQFSIPYVVAACLTDGELGPVQLTEKRISDPAVLALAAKVAVRTDEALDRIYPEKTSSRVEILFKDGRRLARQVDAPRGDPRDPLDAAALANKVKRFAGDRDDQKLDAVIDGILALEKVTDLTRLLDKI
jgi:2-methylcitrate dehydratase PrpD